MRLPVNRRGQQYIIFTDTLTSCSGRATKIHTQMPADLALRLPACAPQSVPEYDARKDLHYQRQQENHDRAELSDLELRITRPFQVVQLNIIYLM